MKMNKKGFTIVELVIVIAVIAILAGVMIPTFGGVIENANESSAQQQAKNVHTSLVAADAELINEVVYITVEKGDGYTYKVENGAFTKMEDKMTAVDGFTAYAAASAYEGYTIPADVTVFIKTPTTPAT